jgi:Zn-dependent protease with chaperone function
VIDDDTPTPRPFNVDPRLRERLTRPEQTPLDDERADEERPDGPRPYERLVNDFRDQPDAPESPPARPRPTTEGTLGARLAERRRLGQRPVQPPPPGDEATYAAADAGDAATDDASGAATGCREPAGARPRTRQPASPGPWEHVAGPADRASFFDEQARHRRQAWRLTAVSTLAVVLAGLPLSLVVTPLIFLAIILLTKLVSFVVPIPEAVPAFYRSVAWAIGAIFNAVEASDRGPVPWSTIGAALLGAVCLLVPGILAMLGLWRLLRRLFSGAGVGGLVIGLGAREPDLTGLEERQLVNVVEEMAIAAGLPAPKVMLLDGQIANAAVVGSGPEDAVVVVSRRLLDEMNRDETQGILAHQVASIGNGDLGVALSMVTVFRTFGLVNTLLDAPISSSARQTLWRLWAVLSAPDGRDAAVRAAEAARLLGSRVSMMEMEDVDIVLGNDESRHRELQSIGGWLLRFRVWALFPIWAAAGLAKTALMVMVFALISPLLAWTWRARRFLADATAVQLTRNPDGIARGLQGLLARGGGIRGGAWADHLFVVGGGVTDRARAREADIAELRAEAERESEGTSGLDRMAARLRAGDRYRQRLLAEDEASRGTDESEIGQLGWVSVHPSLPSRLKRLRAMGAHVDEAALAGPKRSPQDWVLIAAMSPLLALIVFLLGIVVLLSTGLVIVFMMIPMGIVYLVFESLF